MERYYRRGEELLASARRVREAGLGIIAFQGGDVPRTTGTIGGIIPEVKREFSGEVEEAAVDRGRVRPAQEPATEPGEDVHVPGDRLAVTRLVRAHAATRGEDRGEVERRTGIRSAHLSQLETGTIAKPRARAPGSHFSRAWFHSSHHRLWWSGSLKGRMP
jgi:hypothetical protein